jgi:hypothetical protein
LIKNTFKEPRDDSVDVPTEGALLDTYGKPWKPFKNKRDYEEYLRGQDMSDDMRDSLTPSYGRKFTD